MVADCHQCRLASLIDPIRRKSLQSDSCAARGFARPVDHSRSGKSQMQWTLTNLLIQIITGILGGHAAATASKEHSFGALGHTIAGAAGGALSGTFFQSFIGTVVTASGSVTEPTAFEQALIQAVTGAVVGGICTLLVGLIKRSIDEHKSSGR
jgi:uncharacterized membrane protein YeaQ/YmgE (transglycosylase-associated protein family)